MSQTTAVEQQGRYEHKIVTGVVGAVSDPQGRVLFVAQKRGPFGGHWILPGGGIEPGESAEATVVREFQEETGLTIQNPQYYALYEMRGAWAGGAYHILLLAFKATVAGEIPADFVPDGVGGARWAKPAEMPLHGTDLRFLTDAGLAHFSAEEIEAALARDGVTLRVYRT